MIATLVAPSDEAKLLPVTFEQAYDRLAALPGMLIEPDGSFVWSSPAAWRLEGVLYDQGQQLSYIELRGRCDERAFDQFLQVIGCPEVGLMFQLVAAAVFVDEQTLRQLIWPTQARGS